MKSNAEAQRRYRKRHPDRIRAYKKKKLQEPAEKEKARLRARRWRSNNNERSKQACKDWQARNPAAAKALRAKRRATLLGAMPKWANKFFIQEAYEARARRQKMMGIKLHVDHVIPLCGRKVCGLHVETNLQIIPAIENLRKNRNVIEEHRA
jgi:hypothetical protein